MLTRAPFLASSPACGDWLTTRPLGTAALDASDATGLRPAWRSVAPAACSLCPTTLGTLTDELGWVSRTASTTAAASTTAPSPHSRALRLRRSPRGAGGA